MRGRDLPAYERLAYFLRAYRLMRHKPKRILDVGSGFGVKTFYIAHVFPDTRVTGIDPGIEVVERGLRIKREKSIENIDFARIDIRELETKECYDLVIMSDVLEHIEDDRLAIRNARRALKQGGILYVHAPYVGKDFDLEKLEPGAREEIIRAQRRIGHHRLGYSSEELRVFFRDGFRTPHIERCGFRLSLMACRFTEYFCAKYDLDSIDEFYRLPNFLFHDFKFLIDIEVLFAGLLNFMHDHPVLKHHVPWNLCFNSIHAWGRKKGSVGFKSSQAS